METIHRYANQPEWRYDPEFEVDAVQSALEGANEVLDQALEDLYVRMSDQLLQPERW